jgi:hypothetical protein
MGTATSWESLALVCVFGFKEQNKLVFGAQEHLKGPWALSFFFYGLWSTLFTTVGSQRPREIIISEKRAKKSALGRRVPKSWALLDLSALLHLGEAG